LLGGCVSTSTAADQSRVRELTSVPQLARVTEDDVDPASDEDARRLLTRPIDADAAVRIALLNNRELRATLREVGVARGQLVQAGLLPNPRVEVELLPERNSKIALRAEYHVTGAVLAPLRARAAEPDLDAARYRAAAAVVAVGYEVRRAFVAVQAAELRLGLAERTLDVLAAGREAADALLEAGNIPELEASQQIAAFERARAVTAGLELELASSRERLHRLLGVHGEQTQWELDGPLPALPELPPGDEQIETRVLQANFELKEAKLRLEGLARRAGVARTAGWLPDVVADVHGLRGDPSAATGEGGEWLFGVGVNVSLPVFDRNQGTVTALGAEFDAALERMYGQAIALRSAAREARNRVQSTFGRARHYQTVILPALARVTEQSLLQYNAMQIGIFQLLQARREQLEAELAFVDVLRDYWQSTAELAALTAGATPGSSAAPDGGRAASSLRSLAGTPQNGGH
jgi:outer membrane protein TolC